MVRSMMFGMEPITAAAVLLVALVYLLWGRGVVGAAHAANPSLRSSPQIYQFLGVVLWAPIAFANWRRRARHRARLRPRG